MKGGRTNELEVIDQLKSILERRIDTIMIVGDRDGGRDQIDAHLGTDGERVRGLPNFTLEIVEGPDHAFSPLWSQAWLEQMVVRRGLLSAQP
jgi:hypothetical protein